MTLTNLLESVDLPCLVGFLGFLAILAWLRWIDGGPWGREVLPEPVDRCVTSRHEAQWIGKH